MSLNYNHLFYFHTVATEGTLARAATKLGVTQPTISLQLKTLEESLGTKLFVREPSGLRLTDDGLRAFEHTAVAFRSTHRMLDVLATASPMSRKLITVGMTPSITGTFAARFFAPLYQSPALQLRIRQGSYMILLRDVTCGELDILLAENTPTDGTVDDIETVALMTPRLIAVAAPDMARRCTEFPNSLGQLPFVGFGPPSTYRWETLRWFQVSGIETNIVAEADSVDVLATMVRDGQAFSVLPESAIRAELDSGALVKLGDMDFQSHVYAHYLHKTAPAHVMDAIKQLKQN